MTASTTLAVDDDPMIEHRACANCGHSLNDQGMSVDRSLRGWIHTETGQYKCPSGSYPESDGFALPMEDTDSVEAKIERAAQEAYETSRAACEETMYDDEQMDDAKTEAHNAGVTQGRADYSAELNGAITAALHRYRTGAALTGERLAVYEALNEALTEAWESVAL